MKVLLVNNDSDSWDELQATASAAGYEITPVTCRTIGAIDPLGYDLAILSGGWFYDDPVEMLQNYAEELEFIKSAPIPILGICVGMQLMHIAEDEALSLLGERQSGWKDIDVTVTGRAMFGFGEKQKVFKNHDRAIIETNPNFEVLATSPGFTEMMLHKSKPLLGVQFHPEMGDTTDAADMMKILVDALVELPKPRVLY